MTGDPSTETWRETVGLSTSAQLRQTQRDLAASQQDLTTTLGTVVDLLYIIDAFQIESGADREASYETGIEAVRRLREAAEGKPCAWRDLAVTAMQERDLARAQLDDAIATFRADKES